MPARRFVSRIAAAACVVSLAACSASNTPSPTGAVAGATATPPAVTASPPPSHAAASVTPSVAPSESRPESPALAGEDAVTEVFPEGHFATSTVITNRWLPFVPGTQWAFEGSATVDGERIKRKVVLTTTDLVKVIDGVPTVVNYELDYDEGKLVEGELAFFGQADDGTVWHFGEYPEEYEDGEFVEAPTWLAGLQGGHAGIQMLAEPRTALPSYSQGWGPAVDWTDRGRVFETASTTCVPAGCYPIVLVIDEFNRDEPDAHQLKYYAEGVGGVRVGWAGAKEEERETLELVKLAHLDEAALAKVRTAALALDKHGYVASKDVYAQTTPAEQR